MKAAKCLLVAGIIAVAFSSVMAESLTSPIQGKVGYSFMSDYMWRGLNMSRILGNNLGGGAQEMTYAAGINLADLSPDYSGQVWVTYQQAYFNHFDFTDAHEAKNDISVSYTNAVPFLDADWTIAYRYYSWNAVKTINAVAFPNMHLNTQEITLQLALNDGCWWKSATGADMGKRVLNPTFQYVYDYDLADNGGLLLFGLSHAFDLAEVFGPDLTGLSLTPSWQVAMDNRFYKRYVNGLAGENILDDEGTTKVAYMEYGLNLGADISKMASMKSGKLTLNGGVAFVNAFEKIAKNVLTDQLYSYVNVQYKW
ncbi:MAG: hypothetical protein A2Y07_03005 [Planctomycetes bacterium GWF2_50_10]|nr:MAG: hypothetical protein A2Y07_03005 [Planctomycetes bacterium GWF2_50_10]